MILPLVLLLIQVVSVSSQSTLLDTQCNYECRNDEEIHRMVNVIENMERDILFSKDAIERSEKKIMELETKLDTQKTSYDLELSNLNSQLSDQENKFENSIQEIDQKVRDQKHIIDLLQTKVSELESKIQVTNVESSTSNGVTATPTIIDSTTKYISESNTSEDCEDIQSLGYQSSGVYSVNAENGQTKRVYCEMAADGKPWTRILHRQDNLTDFTFKKWVEYEAGFGDPQGSHWMGLVQMHQLTTTREYELRVDLVDWENGTRFAEYSTFRLGPGSDKYRLIISGYSGTAGNSMGGWHNSMMFTTIDNDNDRCTGGCHCANGKGLATGGWWYNDCFTSRLTGPYLEGGDVAYAYGIQWMSWRGYYYSYKVATMKIRRL